MLNPILRGGGGPESISADEFPQLPGSPRVLPRSEHCISRRNIDPDALKVMRRLLRNGYLAFLVGGGVRDLLLGKVPKDYDVGTDARTEVVRTLFRNSRIIGRRFKINHIYFYNNKIIELATFRDESEQDSPEGSPIRVDNTYGNPETDALRRDLTINGLFYDLRTFSVIDYVGGIEDLRHGVIRIIGEPERRIREDPIRMIRAIRHAARTGFVIEPSTYDAICRLAPLLEMCSPARITEEFCRDLCSGSAFAVFRLMDETGVLGHLLPFLHLALSDDRAGVWRRVEAVLRYLDRTINNGREVSLAVAFLGVIIGNLPRDMLSRSPEERRLRAQYLELWPDGADDLSAETVIDIEPAARWSSRAKSAAPTAMGKVLRDMFSVVKVSRREREKMEQLLQGRRLMFHYYDEGRNPQAICGKSYFDEALLLLEATGQDEQTARCASYWRSIKERELENKRRGTRRRRGRGRSRKRTAQPRREE